MTYFLRQRVRVGKLEEDVVIQRVNAVLQERNIMDICNMDAKDPAVQHLQNIFLYITDSYCFSYLDLLDIEW